jgi:hypothetical protein
MRRRSIRWRLFLAACAVVSWLTGCSNTAATDSNPAVRPTTAIGAAAWSTDACRAVGDGHPVAVPPVAGMYCASRSPFGGRLLPPARWPR